MRPDFSGIFKIFLPQYSYHNRARDLDAKRTSAQIDLDSPRLRSWRVMWMRIVDLANEREVHLYQQLTGFPPDLPDLARLRPPSNSRPEGIPMSWYAIKQRNQLPQRY